MFFSLSFQLKEFFLIFPVLAIHPFLIQTFDVQSEIQRDLLETNLYGPVSNYICGPSQTDKIINNRTVCECSEECLLYDTCCLDKFSLSPSNRGSFRCERLGVTNKYYYMKRACSKSWLDNMTRAKCVKDAEEFDDASHFYDVPYYHKLTRTLYKNYFCLYCNNISTAQEDVDQWNFTIFWNGPSPVNFSMLGAFTPVYNSNTRMYTFTWKGENYSVATEADQYKWKNFTRAFHTRECDANIVAECPSTSDAAMKLKCSSYTAYVHDRGKIYKNYHCAKCHNASDNSLVPGLRKLYGRELLTSTKISSVKTLINLQDPEKSINFCKKNEIYVPLVQKCSQFECPNGSVWTSEGCRTEYGSNTCVWVFFDIGEVAILSNRSLYINRSGDIIEETRYMTLMNREERVSQVKVCVEFQVALRFDSVQSTLSDVTLCLSTCCLFLLLILYSLLPNLRRRNGRTVMSLAFALIVAQISFIMIEDFPHHSMQCYVTAVLIHYFYLCAFFWMNVMALDVCRAFVTNIFELSSQKVFLKYSLYAWLCPLLIVVIALTTDKVASDSEYSPGYGQIICWIRNKYGLLLFFLLPIALIVIINLLLFGRTAYAMCQMDMSIRVHVIRRNSERRRFIMYLKLAATLGLPWTFGFIAAFTDTPWLWYPFIIFNGLQGAFIFASFAFSKLVVKEIRKEVSKRSSTMSSSSLLKSPSAVSRLLGSFRSSPKRQTIWYEVDLQHNRFTRVINEIELEDSTSSHLLKDSKDSKETRSSNVGGVSDEVNKGESCEKK